MQKKLILFAALSFLALLACCAALPKACGSFDAYLFAVV
jgi:starvation-inducible outer membrane lipoprotein